MTFYEDLSEYSYLPDQPKMINIGWLARGVEFPVGDIEPAICVKLLVLADEPANLMRGFHGCDFCDLDLIAPVEAPVPRGHVWLGNGELHITGQDGAVSCRPPHSDRPLHGRSRIKPPEVFLDALGGPTDQLESATRNDAEIRAPDGPLLGPPLFSEVRATDLG